MQAPFALDRRTAGPRRRLPFHLLTVLDLGGLAAVVSAMAMTYPSPRDSLLASLTVVAFGTWLLTAQVRTLSTILQHSRNYPLVSPSMAVLVVAAMRLTAGEDFPLGIAVTFAMSWTMWMLAWRVIRSRTVPPIRILTIASSDILAEIADLPSVSITTVDNPPNGFEGFDVVALDPVAQHSDEWMRWLLHADMAGVKLLTAPLIIETLTHQLPLEALYGDWARFLVGTKRPYARWKRLIDVLFVLALAPIWLPVLILVLLAVYLDDRGPLLFWQDRIGQFGQPFRMAKVRSMKVGADAHGPTFAGRDDPRVTRIGHFLRRFRLDELPQFWNVLKGDMSIIGPRPEQIQFSRDFEERFPLYSLRYNLRPGITGWAQVKQGYAADLDENYGKLRHDLYYVRHVSPILDVKIVLLTFYVLVNGYGSR